MNKLLLTLLFAVGISAVTQPAMARQGADDPAGHVRQARGLDDPAGHVRQARGLDDPAGHVRGGVNEHPAGHQ